MLPALSNSPLRYINNIFFPRRSGMPCGPERKKLPFVTFFQSTHRRFYSSERRTVNRNTEIYGQFGWNIFYLIIEQLLIIL
jgi:hypothetical protein